MMKRPLTQLILARIREFYREPAAVFWVYGFPLLLSVGLGIAFRNRPVESIRVDLVVASDTQRADMEAVAERWMKLDERLVITVNDQAEASNRLRTDKASLMVQPDASAAKWKVIFDNNRPGSVLARATMENVILRDNNQQANLPTAELMPDESGGRYIDFLMPGLLGTNLMGGGLFGVGFVIVDMRVRKLLKRFLATPMKRTDFMLSIMASRLLFTLSEIIVLLGAAYFFFGVKIHGNLFALVVLLFLGGSCFAGMGLLVASRAKTLETASGLMNAIMLPMYVVSGVFFPASNFPEIVQPFIQILPLTALNNGLRSIINDGSGFEALFPSALVLIAWGGLSFFLALKLFRWR
jgi:ABC-type multidrug transport system permease subunit